MEKIKRDTKQRRLIQNILCSTDSHPTAESIYLQAREVLPDISLGTVYRNLQVLLDQHEILELNYGKGFSRFDGNPAPHYHFVCEKCGSVHDLNFPIKQDLTAAAARELGCSVNDYRLEFYGICKKCLL